MYLLIIAILPLIRWRESRWNVHVHGSERLDGQVVIITGATSGLGRVLAEDVAKRGAITILACRNVGAANQVVAEIKQGNPNVIMVIS